MIYILHFDKPYYHAKHYIGFSDDPSLRFKRHLSRTEQPLLKAVVNAGIGITMKIIDPKGDRNRERQLKKQKNSKRFCPICQGR